MFKKLLPLVMLAFISACSTTPAENPCCCKGLKPGVQCPMKDKDGATKECCCKNKHEGEQCPMKGKKGKKAAKPAAAAPAAAPAGK